MKKTNRLSVKLGCLFFALSTLITFGGGQEITYSYEDEGLALNDRFWVPDTLEDGKITAVVIYHGWGASQALDRNNNWRAFAERYNVLL